MNKIIQTEVDEEAIDEIDNEIASLVDVMEDANRNINYLREVKNKLKTTYFCDKKIEYEHEEEYSSGRLNYELIVAINKVRVRAKAYTSAHDDVTFVANIEGDYRNNRLEFNIKTFDEAKQICRQWLADLIYDKYQEDDNEK